MMEVKADSGEIVQKWGPGERLPEGADKMSSALKKLDDEKKKRESLFERKKGELEEQKKKIHSVFEEQVEKIKKEGVKENPFRPFDLD
jgi:hypothetical protein